jgi:hypothetical protein
MSAKQMHKKYTLGLCFSLVDFFKHFLKPYLYLSPTGARAFEAQKNDV